MVSGYDEEYLAHAVFDDLADAQQYAGRYRHSSPIEDIRIQRLASYGSGEQPCEVNVYDASVILLADGSLSEPEVSYGRRTDEYMGSRWSR